ncbi:uncharacterized protein LOC106180515 [Lingula anatina]|uniref:Uncharacterized protein LOC106180515 n=1 Tax=Lingula anatina TaxID=7574 RepID=A0A1S3KBV9_LINAN|nr:uncharacterized protein LOC106180515 [Lingula anatina]|eukprot:XP_013419982.1 uncharacterized protein LOC106180515 [Lingula anatina]
MASFRTLAVKFASILLRFSILSVSLNGLVVHAQNTTLGAVVSPKSNSSEASPGYAILSSSTTTTQRPNSSDNAGTQQCPSTCYLLPVDDSAAARIQEMKTDKVLLMEFNLKLRGYGERDNPLRPGNFSNNYKPGHWVRTGTNHGFTLMALEFNYEILSLMMLRFRTDKTDISLKESNPGCLVNMPEHCKIEMMQDLVLKEFDPNKTSASVPAVIPKHTLTTVDIANFKTFKNQVKELPKNTIVERMLPKFHLSVDYKELLDENSVPVGVMNLIYRMFCECQIRKIGPCVACCKASLLGCCRREFPVKWIHFWKGVLVILFILFLPFPFYIRLLLYFGYEDKEIMSRKNTIEALGLNERYSNNLLQFLTPIHPVFIACYVLYFVTCLVFCLAYANVIGTGKVQMVMKNSFRDLNSISYFNIIGMVVGVFLLPLKMCGCFGLIVGIVYWPLVMPFVLLAAVIYSLPTVYLTFRMMFNVHMHIKPKRQKIKRGPSVKGVKRDFKDGFKEVKCLMDVTDKKKKESDQLDQNLADDENNPKKDWGELNARRSLKHRCLDYIKEIFVVILCLAFLYTCMLLLAEVAELIVEVIVFTLMGIIVNAGITLKYISLLFLVALYSYDCYNGVYKTYLDLSKKIISDVNGRIPEVKEVTRLPSHLQQNEAFKLKIETDYDQEGIEADFSPKHKTDYEISNLVLFVDRNDTPRIPRKLFEKMCQIEVAGSPGPVYKNLLRATAKFVCILIFLLFVFIVVATFGNIYKISTTNQMFATLAGGFIPFMLRNFLSPGGAATGYKSSVSWQAKFDETIVNFRQHWPIADIELVPVQEEMSDISDDKIGGKGENDAMDEIELRNEAEEPQSPTMDNSEVDLLVRVVRRKRPTLGEILTGKGLSKEDNYRPVGDDSVKSPV